MKIGILGSGVVGRTLAKAFKSEGHEVVIATREPDSDKGKALAAELEIPVRDFAETAAFADLAVLCTLWTGTEDAIILAGPDNLKGKVVIDATNPLGTGEGVPQLSIGRNDSAGERVQTWLPGSHVVKAFNTVGAPLMYKPQPENGPPAMFYAGNDQEAKKDVAEILRAFGFEPIDIGDITGARELEPLCILWVKYGVTSGTWNHTFKLLH